MPGVTQRAAEGSSQAAGLSVADPSPTRAPLLELFCNIPMEPPSPERCESPCSAMLCECAQHLTATCQAHRPSEPSRCLRAQEATRPPAAVKQATALLTGVDASRRSALACCESSCCRPALTPVRRACLCVQVLLRRRLDSRARCVARVPATPSKRSGCLNGKAMQAHPPTAARCGSHGVGCLARRKRGGAHMRRSAPCHILSVDPWASDDSPGPPTGSDRCEYESVPSLPLVSLSPTIREAVSPGRPTAAVLALRTARCDAAVRVPGVRWSCPALMVHCTSPCSMRRLGSATARRPRLLRLALLAAGGRSGGGGRAAERPVVG